jgi:hypothetical protein
MKLKYILLSSLATIVTTISTLAATNELTTQPDKDMAAAHEAFAKGDMKTASTEIHKAATYVKNESKKVAAGSQAGVKAAGESLDKLGDDVKAGTIKSGDELNKAFARTDHALATAWHATGSAAQTSSRATSRALRQTGTALAGAAHWSGQTLSVGTQKTVDAVRQAGTATDKGVKASAEAVSGWFKDLGDGIKDVAQKL